MIVENNMTEIHERLQPVAEVGENGSNGEEDSITGDQEIIPLGRYGFNQQTLFNLKHSYIIIEYKFNNTQLQSFYISIILSFFYNLQGLHQ